MQEKSRLRINIDNSTKKFSFVYAQNHNAKHNLQSQLNQVCNIEQDLQQHAINKINITKVERLIDESSLEKGKKH